jgi:hypothetical protein
MARANASQHPGKGCRPLEHPKTVELPLNKVQLNEHAKRFGCVRQGARIQVCLCQHAFIPEVCCTEELVKPSQACENFPS